MSNDPLVSIITPVKNRPELIRETLRSVQAQTYTHWEAVVVDDRSTDETREVVAAMAAEDERIRLFQRPEGKGGAPVCRNIGVEEAQGEYIIYLDSDDLLGPECLERRVEFMEEHPEIDFGVFQGAIFYKEPGDTNRINNLAHEEDDLNRFLRRDITWQTSGPIYRTSATERIGPWDESLPGGQDVDYATRAMALGLEHKCVNKVDYYIRSSRDDRGRISANKWKKPERLRSFVYRTSKLCRLLNDQGRLTEQRKRLIAGNFLFVADRWADLGDKQAALQAWKKAQNFKLANQWKFLYVSLYLKLRNTSASPFLAYYMYYNWAEELFIQKRLKGGRYTSDQEPGVYEVPVGDGQHPFRRYARVFRQGPLRFVIGYVKRSVQRLLDAVGLRVK